MPLNTDKAKTVSDAIETRITVREYLDKPVPEAVLTRIFEKARRAPSGGNLQPWNVHVITGKPLKAFVDACIGKLMKGETEEDTHPAYPSPLWEPMRTWRFKLGEDMYKLLGIPREDKPARLRQVARNFTFFDAPVGIIFTMDKRMDVPQYLDMGIYLQTIMLLAREEGLHTTPQGAWRSFPETARQHLDFPDEQEVVVGMSMGYGDPDANVNNLRSDRAELDELVKFYKD